MPGHLGWGLPHPTAVLCWFNMVLAPFPCLGSSALKRSKVFFYQEICQSQEGERVFKGNSPGGKKKKISFTFPSVFSFFCVHLLWKEARLSSATSLISDVLHLWWAGEMWELIEYCLPVVSMLTTSTDLYILDTERCVPLNLLARFGFYTFWSISSWHYVYAFWLEHVSWSI